MPQALAVIVGFIILAYVVAAIVWIVQWLWACILFVFQVFIFPFFVFLTPSVLAIIGSLAFYWGSWIAVNNYFNSIKTKVHSEGFAVKVTNFYIKGTLSLLIAAGYIATAVVAFYLITLPIEPFVYHVRDYFQAINFPAYRIVFPFWDR